MNNSKLALDNNIDTALSQEVVSKRFKVHLPLDKVVVSSGYGIRKDPFTKKNKLHMGIDLKAKHGQKAYAMLPGVISAVGKDNGRGIYVSVTHGEYIITYCHLSRVAVRRQQSVDPGDVVGYVGSTGRSTGPHLHLSLKKGSKTLNPCILLKFLIMNIKRVDSFNASQDFSATPLMICPPAI